MRWFSNLGLLKTASNSMVSNLGSLKTVSNARVLKLGIVENCVKLIGLQTVKSRAMKKSVYSLTFWTKNNVTDELYGN